ncbi:MAG: selenocysteine-specific translation elongation factor [Chloroflexi bacterium]|nr:selenocysteine-specific translation elongation factor [Chloroflexota bacterium]
MHYVIGTAGHVDHGKSTLVEVLTGIDPDRLAEEKQRAMTIDLGFAWTELPDGTQIGIVDVPGHRDFIENMLAGVGGIDLALLVVAADEGVMPQTREHLAILDLLNIPSAVVALTKIDMVDDPEWLELVQLDLADLLALTHLAEAPIIPVSALTNDGLDQLLLTLEETLQQRQPRPDLERPRLPIDRVFTVSGFGTIVTGTLTGGRLVIGDDIEIQPGGLTGRVRGLQSHKEAVEVAQPGKRVAVNVGGLDRDDLARGQVLARPGILRGTQLIDTMYRHLHDAPRALEHDTEVKFFSGAAETVATVRLIGDDVLLPGGQGWLQVVLSEPLALDQGDRYILRVPSPAQTIGGGEILDAHPAHRWRRFKPDVITRFQALSSGRPEDRLLNTLNGLVSAYPVSLVSDLGLSDEEIGNLIDSLGNDIIHLSDGKIMSQAMFGKLIQQLQQELTSYHEMHPLRLGMPREALRSRLGLNHSDYHELLALAEAERLIESDASMVRLASHELRFTPQQETALTHFWTQVEADPTKPPTVKEILAELGEPVFDLLVQRGDLIRVSKDIVFDLDTYRDLVRQIEDYLRVQGSITVAEGRDLLNTTRKYILPLLEHLDQVGLTRRDGDQRVLNRQTKPPQAD